MARAQSCDARLGRIIKEHLVSLSRLMNLDEAHRNAYTLVVRTQGWRTCGYFFNGPILGMPKDVTIRRYYACLPSKRRLPQCCGTVMSVAPAGDGCQIFVSSSLMSAFASSGHSRLRGYVREVPIPDLSRCSKMRKLKAMVRPIR
jgi:hypothetical protein